MKASRVYVLSSSEDLAAQSELGETWPDAWTDPEGRRLLPFRAPPPGHPTMTLAEAQAYRAEHQEAT